MLEIKTFTEAVNTLKNGCDRDTKHECLKKINAEVEPLCSTPIATAGETSLFDWLSEGDWSNPQTASEIAKEWDSLYQSEE